MNTASKTPEAWKTIELEEPIHLEGKEPVKVLELQEPCARHLRNMPAAAPTFGDLLDIGGAMSGVPPEVIDELCMPDYQSIMGPIAESMAPLADIQDWSKVDNPQAPKTPHVLTLKKPIQVGSEKVKSLTFSAPKAKHIRAMPADGGTFGDVMTVAGKMTGEAPSLIERLGPEDFAAVAELVTLFLIGSRPTGDESSGT